MRKEYLFECTIKGRDIGFFFPENVTHKEIEWIKKCIDMQFAYLCFVVNIRPSKIRLLQKPQQVTE